MSRHDEEQEQIKRNEKLVEREVYACVILLVEYILKQGMEQNWDDMTPPFSWDDVENLFEPCGRCKGTEDADDCDEPEPREIYEWWAVSPWLFEQLREQGEPVIDTFPHLWGRTTTGQAIAIDGVISRIERKLREEVEK